MIPFPVCHIGAPPEGGGGSPLITVTPSEGPPIVLDAFTAESYLLEWVDLTADIEITIDAVEGNLFQVSQTGSGSGFSNTQTVDTSGGDGSITIWVRKNPGYAPFSGTYTGDVDNASAGATTQSVAVEYTEP